MECETNLSLLCIRSLLIEDCRSAALISSEAQSIVPSGLLPAWALGMARCRLGPISVFSFPLHCFLSFEKNL
jgi:hypothetical protein